jgi:hypothetical protein
MTPNKIEQEAPAAPGHPAAAPPSPPPQDVEDFRSVLTGISYGIDDVYVEHVHDHKPSPECRTGLDEQRDPRADEEKEEGRRPDFRHEKQPTATSAPRPAHDRVPQQQGELTGVAPRKHRQRMGSHQERQEAMEPLAQLIAALRARQSEQVTQLNIVPPSSNRLRLTLQVTGDDQSFVVKARTSLPQDRRDEVKQALNVLEQMLKQRLPESVVVTVTLLA